MAKDAREYGPTAERVAANIRALREARGLSLGALSRRLDDLGQSISLGGLSKLELGQRRVDVDDLVALAVALDVAPSRLLLPATADQGQVVALTPSRSVDGLKAWEWASGEAPLPAGEVDLDLDALGVFCAESRPHRPQDSTTVAELREIVSGGHLRALVDGYRAARQAGATHEAVLDYLALVESLGILADVAREEGQG